MSRQKDFVVFPPILRKYNGYLTQINRSPQTIHQYNQDLLTFFRFMVAYKNGVNVEEENLHDISIAGVDLSFVESITDDDLYEYLLYLTSVRGNLSASRARKLSAVRRFFEYLTVVEKSIEKNPAEHITSPTVKQKLPKFLTESESQLLLQTVAADEASPYRARDYAMITLFLNCGMRLSELTGIDLTDLDPSLRSLRVLGKGSKERIIYLNGACRDALQNYFPVRTMGMDVRDKNALFLSRLGRRISNQTVQHIVYKYLDAAGLGYKHLSTHKLRHTAATLMYQSGKVDVRVLKDILGHEQLNTTQIYTHVSNVQMEKAMQENPLADLRRSGNGITEADEREESADSGSEKTKK